MATATLPDRRAPSITAPPPQQSAPLATPRINVGQTERWLSLFGGSALALYGLRQGSLRGLATALTGGGLIYRGVSGHCSAYGALGVSTAASTAGVKGGHGFKVEQSMTINRSAADLYRFWRDLKNLPRVMRHLESIEVEGNRSLWVMRGPLNVRLHWEAEIYNDKPNELIAWRSLAGGDVDSAGSVRFQAAPVGRGTVVRVEMKIDPPAGRVGATLAQIFGEDPKSFLREDLRRFKQLMEAGEIATTEGQASGRR